MLLVSTDSLGKQISAVHKISKKKGAYFKVNLYPLEKYPVVIKTEDAKIIPMKGIKNGFKIIPNHTGKITCVFYCNIGKDNIILINDAKEKTNLQKEAENGLVNWAFNEFEAVD